MRELCSFSHQAGYLNIHLGGNNGVDLTFFEWDDLAKKHTAQATLQGFWHEQRQMLLITLEPGVLEFKRVKGAVMIGAKEFKVSHYVLGAITWSEAIGRPDWLITGERLVLIERAILIRSLHKLAASNENQTNKLKNLFVFVIILLICMLSWFMLNCIIV